MNNNIVYVNGAVLIYTPENSIAFRVTRHIIDPDRGVSQYIITDGIGQVFLALDSVRATSYIFVS